MGDAALSRARILIVDDEDANILLLRRVLERAGFVNLESTTDATRALALFERDAPDLLLLDLRMPVVDGFAVLERLRPAPPLGHVPADPRAHRRHGS